MKPSIGRVVHLNVAVPSADGSTPDAITQHAALVVAVHGDACVSLCVFDPCGGTSHASSVSLGTAPGTWAWPAKV